MSSTPPTSNADLPATDSADPEITIPWNPGGALAGSIVVLLMVGGSLPFLWQSGSLAIILMGVLFIFFASAIAGAIVYASTLEA